MSVIEDAAYNVAKPRRRKAESAFGVYKMILLTNQVGRDRCLGCLCRE